MSFHKEANVNTKYPVSSTSNLKNFVTVDTNTSAHQGNNKIRKESDFSSKF